MDCRKGGEGGRKGRRGKEKKKEANGMKGGKAGGVGANVSTTFLYIFFSKETKNNIILGLLVGMDVKFLFSPDIISEKRGCEVFSGLSMRRILFIY